MRLTSAPISDSPMTQMTVPAQQADGGYRQLQRPAHDERHRHGARVHDEQVLEPQDEQPGRGQHLVHGMNRRPVSGFGRHGFGRVGQ
jgi:hypothetical protein